MQEYANIIVDISHESVDRPFSYCIPESLKEGCKIGTRVNVPFGRGNKIITGYIIEITQYTDVPKEKIKCIDSISSGQNAVEANMISLASFIKEQYGSTMIAALKTVLPVKQVYRPIEKRTIELLWDYEKTADLLQESIRKHQTAKERLLKELINEKILDYQLVTQKLNVAAATINSLVKTGTIRILKENYLRNPVMALNVTDSNKELNTEQRYAVDTFTSNYKTNKQMTYLLHGITGSGKTEVYIQMIKEVIQSGRQVIVLIPEIALTYQTLMRFYKHFKERVSVMNSSLSQGEKFDQFKRAKNGEIDVIIGPRSALFTPFPNIGLIVMDEEHENSYKSETMPRYHAREVAIEIARMHHASVVLGSATPSVESYYKAQNGEFFLLPLNNRATGGILPKVYTVDLRQELKDGNRSIFSRKLKELMDERLKRKEQIMLFLNRRGYAGFISCRACGEVMKCPHCDVSLSEHKNGKLVCHYCGYEIERPPKCPKCGSKYLLSFRAGTEQIEEQIKKIFPYARVLRMDGDTTKQKDSYNKILTSFSDGDADILVGTQMIVKGHDFPNVTLVGILAADLSLAANDYRAGERTFELLTQAAGRAGRGKKEGEVVIQTYQPGHYSVVHAANQDYEGFYEEEMMYRELSSYPPAYDIIAVMLTSKNEAAADNLSKELSERMRLKKDKKIIIIGPATAGISKINDYYRYVFYMKSKNKNRLIQYKNEIEEYLDKEKRDCMVQFDFNPMNPY